MTDENLFDNVLVAFYLGLPIKSVKLLEQVKRTQGYTKRSEAVRFVMNEGFKRLGLIPEEGDA